MEMVEVTKDNVGDYVCARIFGGLGNQMFQYAAAISQAKRLNLKLLLHVVGSDRLKHAHFGLEEFPITADIWNDQVRAKVSMFDKVTGRESRRMKRGAQWLAEQFSYDGLTFTEKINAVKPGTYISGYFQSEDYFAKYEELIRKEFSLATIENDLDTKSKALVERKGSVSVHIRRGDYLFDPKVLKIHGIMENDYYEAARTLIQQLVPNCNFCVFSDDRDAANDLTKLWPNSTVMPVADRMHDLALMSKCSHHIVANSSFSWWGAWLNPSHEKYVIGPRRWFTRAHMQNTYTDDICPKGWILI